MNKLIGVGFFSVIFAIIFFTFATKHVTPPGMVGVVIDSPYFFGHGGVREVVQQPGLSWYWSTTKVYDYNVSNFKTDEPIEHLPTSDNNFINYNSYIVLQYFDLPYNVKTFGYTDWYKNNIEQAYGTIVRDVTKRYSMTDIMTNQEVLNNIQKDVKTLIAKHITDSGLRVRVIDVNMGRAKPNELVIAEMDNTAVQQQRKKTETQRKEAEDSRKEAEKSRAVADNAYRNEIALTNDQFVKLEEIKRYSEVCRVSKNCVITLGGSVMVGTNSTASK